MAIEKIALVGANGHLGPSILRALLDASKFQVSVITRASSRSKYPDHVSVLKADDDLPYDQLVNVLTGQDALVISFGGTQKDNSIKLANAAFEAGVRHIIPADFGSCDSSDPQSLDLIPLYVNKKDVRDHLVDLSKKQRQDGSRLSWTSLVTGHFFDYGLKSGLLSINIHKGTARIFDNGDYKFAATTLADVGLATANALQHVGDARLKNKLIYVQSIQLTQNELVPIVEQVMGKKLDITNVAAMDHIKENKGHLAKDKDDHVATEELVTVGGIINTNWDSKGDAYVNDLLRMPARDLKQLVSEALR